MKCLNCKQNLHATSCTVNSQGNHHSFDDLPAVEHSNGSKWWYLNGVMHREDGPAVERSDGSKFWYLNGELHREDGPACEFPDGGGYWYINGVEAIQIPKQKLYIQKSIQIEEKMAIIIENINNNIWKVLIGDEKKLIINE